MEVTFSEKAESDLDAMDKILQSFFIKHTEKICVIPPRRHLRFGLPFNVENVTKQARMSYAIENNTIYIIRCFAVHKDYERWYLSFKQ